MGRKSVDDVVRTRAFWLAYKPGEPSAPAFVPEPPVWWHVALALVAALAVQSTLAPFFTFRGASVSFVLLVVAWYAVRTGTLRGLTFGLMAGACEDALAGTTGAAWTFATAFVGLAFGRIAGTWLAGRNCDSWTWRITPVRSTRMLTRPGISPHVRLIP